MKSCLSNKQKNVLQPSSFAQQKQMQQQQRIKKNYFREKQKNKTTVNKTDKNKPMRLIKEHIIEIIEITMLNKSTISKDTFKINKNRKVYIGHVLAPWSK